MSSGLLDHPPTDDELARLYWELAQLGAPSIGKKVPWSYSPDSLESLLAMAGDMLRYNPRLLSILLQFIVEHWDCLNPRALRESMAKMRWPQALLVVFEFAKIASSKRELHWFVEYVSAGVFARDPAEKFFFDAERPGSRIAKRHAGRNLAPYRRWGFVAVERPASNVFTKKIVGAYDASTRRWIRRELFESRLQLSVSDYLEAIDHCVSRQQAYNDLRNDKTLAVDGHGRGARWRLRKTAESAAI